MKKQVILNYSAIKELDTFSIEIKARFNDLFQILEKKGKLEMPFAKKLESNIKVSGEQLTLIY
jgi:mRNA-degrading endonuclease RelE of RelBE toxin-antitoxin system